MFSATPASRCTDARPEFPAPRENGMTARILIRGCIVATLGLSLVAGSGRAQSAQLFSIQASGLAASFKDQGSSGTNSLVSGFGVEAMARVSPSVWSFGVGFQRTAHLLDGGATLLMTGFFFEPRYAIDIGSDRVAPYVAGRVATLRAVVTASGQEFRNTGTAYGAGAGLLIRLTPRINADIGAAFTQNKFEGSFTGYVAKAGFSLGLGNR
jgi:hypothetical protein